MPVPERGARLNLRLLGGFELSADGVTLLDGAYARRKPKAIVKLLALHAPSWLHRGAVCDALWPDLEGDAAANNLRKNLHLLRTQLSCDVVQQSGDALTLVEGVRVDTEAFRSAATHARSSGAAAGYEKALALYAGELLPEDAAEPWTMHTRDALRRLRDDLLFDIAELYMAEGRRDLAVARLEALLRGSPLREDAHASLMRAHAALGDPAAALRQYDVCRDALERELGASPSAALQHLAELIRESGGRRSPDEWRADGQRTAVTDPVRAAEYFQRAIEALRTSPSPDLELEIDLTLELAGCSAKMGDVAGAFRAYREAYDLANGGEPDAMRVARAALGMYATKQPLGDKYLRPAIMRADSLLSQDDSVLRAQIMTALARWQYPADATSTERAASEMLRRLSAPAAPPREAFDPNVAMNAWMVEPATIDERLRAVREVSEACRELGDEYGEMWAAYGQYRLTCMLPGAWVSNELTEPRARFRSLAEETNTPHARWLVKSGVATEQLVFGNWDRAGDAIRDAFKYGSENVPAIVVAYHYGAQRLVQARETGRQMGMIRRIESNNRRHPGWENDGFLSMLYSDLGRVEDAKPYVRSVVNTLEGVGAAELALLVAEASVACGMKAAMATLYNVLLPYEHLMSFVLGGAVSFGVTARLLGSLAAGLERFEDAERHYRDALRLNRQARARPWVAHTVFEYARMLVTRRADGDVTRARELLGEASAVVASISMPALGAEIERLDAGV